MYSRPKIMISLLVTSLFFSGVNCAAHPPILVLATNANFGSYTGEILKAEGFNEFQIDSLTDPPRHD